MRALRFAFAAIAAISACRGTGAPAGRSGLVYYESYDPRSLDPALSTDVPTGEMATLVFDGLTQFDADGRVLPALADRWTTSPDGRRYVFHLRPGVKFHDGTPLTAAAVRASLLRVLSPATKGGRGGPRARRAGDRAGGGHGDRVHPHRAAGHLSQIPRNAGGQCRAGASARGPRTAACRHRAVALRGVAARRQIGRASCRE